MHSLHFFGSFFFIAVIKLKELIHNVRLDTRLQELMSSVSGHADHRRDITFNKAVGI